MTNYSHGLLCNKIFWKVQIKQARLISTYQTFVNQHFYRSVVNFAILDLYILNFLIETRSDFEWNDTLKHVARDNTISNIDPFK